MSKSTFDLFPAPSPAPSPLSPFRWAGITPESTTALQETLQTDYEKYHVFFNDKGFHNHTAHAVLAAWALGADGTVIRAAYENSAKYQRLAYQSPEPITSQNVFHHLGDENYYNSYLIFFKGELQNKGFSAVLEEYIFSPKANFSSEPHPQMLNRFLAGLIHPFIHVGYGAEFGLPGLIIEGLAQAAVHSAETPGLIPPSLFEASDQGQSLASRLASSLVLDDHSPKPAAPPGVHALTIIARAIKDSKLRVKEQGPAAFKAVVDNHGEAILDLLKDWVIDTTDPKGVEKKIEELVLTNSLLYGVSGWRNEGHFSANFFFMHFVTSSLFLPSLTSYLTPTSQARLLKSYFAVCLALYISRNCPPLNIKGFFASSTTAHPTQPGPQPTPWHGSLASPTQSALYPNPWLRIIQNSIIYPDEHVPKLQRALAHYSAIYGSRQAGEKDLEGVELEGAEVIDGSLFIRAAGLTDERMGRVHGGEEPIEFWDRVMPGAKNKPSNL